MTVFVAQIKKWLKQKGVLFVGNQGGDVIPKTKSMHTTTLAKALIMNDMSYEAERYTLWEFFCFLQ